MIAKYFSEVEDRREPWKVKHSLLEIIVMVITAVVGGRDAWEVIEDFCKVKQEWLKTRLHLKLENGVPSHDTMQRVFGMIKPKEFERSFCAWMGAVTERTDGEIISIDGKTLRGSKDGVKKPLHMVSAWANANQLVLGQIAAEEKSNEITAVPALLDLLDNSAENMAVVRHIVLNVLKNYPTSKKMSLSRKRQKCEYDHDFLADVLSFAANNFHA